MGLALLIGLFGGIVLAAAAGARRTATAYSRMVRETRDADVLVGVEHTGLTGFYDEMARLPGVTATGQLAGVNIVPVDAAGKPDIVDDPAGIASVDDRVGYTIFRPTVLAGRVPRPERADEILANPAMAHLHHLEVGSKVSALVFRDLPDDLRQIDSSQGQPVSLTVVGIGVVPTEVVPVSPRDSGPQFTVTSAFYRAYADPEHIPFDAAVVRLEPGTDISRFRGQVDAIAAVHPEVGQVFFTPQADRRVAAERSIAPQAVALGAFAALAALTAFLVIGQLLGRQRALESNDDPALRSLGMTPRQLFAVATVRAATVAAAGGLVAVALAISTSALFPIGPAGVAEPHPGPAVNVALLAAGVVAIILLLAARVAVSSWRAAISSGRRARADVTRPSRLAETAAGLGCPASVTTGVRMALESGRGATAVPVRTTVTGTLIAITALLAALTFGTSLNNLVATPRLYGQDWDVVYDAGFSVIPTAAASALLHGNPSVAAFSGGVYGDVTVAGRQVAAVGIEAITDSVFPTLLAGRPPRVDDEIVLGTSVLSRLHRRVGDVVTVGAGDGERPMRVVGRAVFPKMGRGTFSTTSLGEGAAVAASVLAQPNPDAPADIYNFMLIRWNPDPAQAAIRQRTVTGLLELAAGCSGASGQCVSALQRPGLIDGYSRVRATPLVLAGLLAALALATLAHTLVTSIRRRRRDLAILKTLGFVRRQVSAAVAWQSTVLAAIAVVIGVPLGVAAGRWLWAMFADQLGVAATARTPVVAVVVVVPAAIVAANLIAAVPARMAARTRAAVVLRSE